MGGFTIFLLVIACIVLLIVAVLSVPVHLSLFFSDKIYVTVKYLFLKFDILPLGEKKEKKPKEEKPPKPKKEKPPKEPKEKKPNAILEMLKANGYDGCMEVLGNMGRVFSLYGGKLLRSVVFDLIDINVQVGTGDAAATAIKYGKTCQKIFPLVGFLKSNNTVKNCSVRVEPDFLANQTIADVGFEMSVTVRKIINATIAMAVRLVFKVVLKFLRGAKKGKANAEKAAPAPANETTTA